MLFQTSDTYQKFEKMLELNLELMRSEFVDTFVQHLHDERYGRREIYMQTPFPQWLVEQGSYSEVVGGQDPVMDLYDILTKVSFMFSQAKFARLVEERIEDLYSKNDTPKLRVKIIDHDQEWDLPRERMTFEFNMYWGAV
jgi:hypothetical protein